MDGPTSTDISLFEGFRLDRRGGVLSRRDENGDFVPLAIGSRALDILGVLVDRPGDLISRAEIIDAVWPGTAVEDSNLNVQVAALRRILDDGRVGSCIQTVSGRGYRFVAPATPFEPATPPVALPFSGNGSGGSIAEGGQPSAPGASGQLGGTLPAAASRDRHRLWGGMMTVIGALSLIAAVVTALNWHLPWSREVPPLPRLSIVVLPFTNLSDDRDQQYFAGGITDDLTTDLSRIAGMVVISRNTAFTYRNKPVDAKQIGRELGVRYVLEGSVRRSDNQVRVNAQLIDAETATHVWAERFDRDLGGLFDLQNEITSRIGRALGGELIAREAARPTEHPDALDYILRGRAAGSKPGTRDNSAEAIDLYERALALEPHSVEAQSRLASALAGRVMNYGPSSSDSDLKRAEELVSQALAASPRSPFAHFAKGNLLRAHGRHTEAILEYETALASDHNWVAALADIARCKTFVGPIEEAIPLLEQAMRLSPRDPNIGIWYDRIGQVHLLQSRIDEAIFWLERSRNARPEYPWVHLHLASAYALKGETEHAGVELAEARKLQREGSFSSIVRLRLVSQFRGARPEIRALFEATYLAGLRKAGMPEE